MTIKTLSGIVLGSIIGLSLAVTSTASAAKPDFAGEKRTETPERGPSKAKSDKDDAKSKRKRKKSDKAQRKSSKGAAKRGSSTANKRERKQERHDGHRRGKGKHAHRFDRVDTNGDGYLTRDEVWARVAVADTNGDNRVSRDEMRQARRHDKLGHGHHEGERRGHAYGKRFKRADDNRDGFITADEVSAERWSRIKKADANGDGKVSKREMKQAFEDGTLGRGKGKGKHHRGGKGSQRSAGAEHRKA